LHPLALAAKNGHPDVVRVFLDAGVDANPPLGWHLKLKIDDREGYGVPEEAVEEDEEVLIPDPLLQFGNPLTFAIQNGHEDVVHLLIEHGVDLEFSPEIGNIQQPLKIAAEQGNLPIVRALFQKGCDPYIQENTGLNALDYAISQGNDLLQMFISAGVDFRIPGSPLSVAVDAGNAAGVRYLLEFGIDPNSPLEYGIHQSFCRAAELRHWEVAKIFLSMIDVDNFVSHAVKEDLVRFLIAAAHCGFEDQVKRCLRKEVPLKVSELSSWTESLQSALQAAVEQGHYSISQLLLNCGAKVYDPDIKKSPMVTAIDSNQIEMVKLLLDKWTSTELRSLKFWMSTALMNGRSEVARELLHRLKLLNVPKEWTQHFLVPSALSGGAKSVDLLLSDGAFLDPDSIEQIGMMFSAAEGGHFELLNIFLQAGFDVNAVDICLGYGHRNLLTTVLTARPVQGPAVAPEPMAELLLQRGANIEARNELTDETPLLYMASRTVSPQGALICERAARFLLQKGATMFFSSNRGRKPLVKAAMKGNVGIVRIFLEYLNMKCVSLDDIKPLVLEAMKTTHRDAAKLLSRWYWRRVYPSPPILEEGRPDLELKDDQP
jgi:ankyrin repeat protein